jgi:hypothetical protein
VRNYQRFRGAGRKQREVEVATESYLRRHVFLTGFVEERFYQNQRIAAMQVGLHHG